jgi:hypothetical protein
MNRVFTRSDEPSRRLLGRDFAGLGYWNHGFTPSAQNARFVYAVPAVRFASPRLSPVPPRVVTILGRADCAARGHRSRFRVVRQTLVARSNAGGVQPYSAASIWACTAERTTEVRVGRGSMADVVPPLLPASAPPAPVSPERPWSAGWTPGGAEPVLYALVRAGQPPILVAADGGVFPPAEVDAGVLQ